MSIRLCSALLVTLIALTSTTFAAGPDTRLAEAARREDRAAIRTLVKQKADVNATLVDGTTALHWAVEAEDLESVGLLISAGADVKAKNRYGVTPLYSAAVNGNARIIAP